MRPQNGIFLGEILWDEAKSVETNTHFAPQFYFVSRKAFRA